MLGGLFAFMTDLVMPAVERGRLGGPASNRLLIGESMGGFNAAEMILKRPGLFSRAALVCPGIASLSPSAGPEAVSEYIRRTGADPESVHRAMRLLKSVFPDDASWVAAAPLSIGHDLLGTFTPALHVSCGDRDEYGFFEGAQAFAALARERGVRVAWQPLRGGHCAADPAALADFLLP